jgi:hypothetical protein
MVKPIGRHAVTKFIDRPSSGGLQAHTLLPRRDVLPFRDRYSQKCSIWGERRQPISLAEPLCEHVTLLDDLRAYQVEEGPRTRPAGVRWVSRMRFYGSLVTDTVRECRGRIHEDRQRVIRQSSVAG